MLNMNRKSSDLNDGFETMMRILCDSKISYPLNPCDILEHNVPPNDAITKSINLFRDTQRVSPAHLLVTLARFYIIKFDIIDALNKRNRFPCEQWKDEHTWIYMYCRRANLIQGKPMNFSWESLRKLSQICQKQHCLSFTGINIKGNRNNMIRAIHDSLHDEDMRDSVQLAFGEIDETLDNPYIPPAPDEDEPLGLDTPVTVDSVATNVIQGEKSFPVDDSDDDHLNPWATVPSEVSQKDNKRSVDNSLHQYQSQFQPVQHPMAQPMAHPVLQPMSQPMSQPMAHVSVPKPMASHGPYSSVSEEKFNPKKVAKILPLPGPQPLKNPIAFASFAPNRPNPVKAMHGQQHGPPPLLQGNPHGNPHRNVQASMKRSPNAHEIPMQYPISNKQTAPAKWYWISFSPFEWTEYNKEAQIALNERYEATRNMAGPHSSFSVPGYGRYNIYFQHSKEKHGVRHGYQIAVASDNTTEINAQSRHIIYAAPRAGKINAVSVKSSMP